MLFTVGPMLLGILPVLISTINKVYNNIKKESFALTWSCERFAHYLLGLPSFLIETDHKPLVPLFNTKLLHSLSSACTWQGSLTTLLTFRESACTRLMPCHELPRHNYIYNNSDAELYADAGAYAHVTLSAVKKTWTASSNQSPANKLLTQSVSSCCNSLLMAGLLRLQSSRRTSGLLAIAP